VIEKSILEELFAEWVGDRPIQFTVSQKGYKVMLTRKEPEDNRIILLWNVPPNNDGLTSDFETQFEFLEQLNEAAESLLA